MFGRATIRLGIGPHSSFIFEVDSCKIHFKEMLIPGIYVQLKESRTFWIVSEFAEYSTNNNCCVFSCKYIAKVPD